MNIQLYDKKGTALDIAHIIHTMDLAIETRKKYQRSINKFFGWIIENKPEKDFRDVSMFDFIEYKRWINEQNYKINTKNSHLTGVMSLYRILEKYGYSNICVGVRLFDGNNENNKEGVNIDDWKKVLKMIKRVKFNGAKHYMIIYMLFISGVRQMSLRHLKWKDFGFSSATNSLQMEVLLKGRGQNRREKIVLTNECVKLIEDYKFKYMRHYCMDKLGGISEIDADWYVFGNKSKPLADSSIRKVTTMWLKRAGVYVLGEVTGHSLRHGIAEYLIESGLSIKAVQNHLCHKNIASTMIYAGKKEKKRMANQTLENLNAIKIGADWSM